MIRCFNCGTQNDPAYAYCANCSQPLTPDEDELIPTLGARNMPGQQVPPPPLTNHYPMPNTPPGQPASASNHYPTPNIPPILPSPYHYPAPASPLANPAYMPNTEATRQRTVGGVMLSIVLYLISIFVLSVGLLLPFITSDPMILGIIFISTWLLGIAILIPLAIVRKPRRTVWARFLIWLGIAIVLGIVVVLSLGVPATNTTAMLGLAAVFTLGGIAGTIAAFW